ncbi:nucleoside phosphorylase-I family protein [Paenibacillus alkalitolerans]|uniref:hypothetical protein n=1 Tax=Paenibacillus alkalitolerans TaxID=2799335 RepID=UPI0018F4637B|nr:hypothetical protein [Paenibacillus alkalitolerans]
MSINQVSTTIPQAEYAIIGGSSRFSISFPEDAGDPDVEMEATGLTFETPYGNSPEFKLFLYRGRRVLHVRMHGWRPNVVTRGVASQQLFWVLGQAR